MKEYEICDMEKNILSPIVLINAKTPLEAAKKYIEELGENKDVKRDFSNTGRLVIRGNTASYVYKVA